MTSNTNTGANAFQQINSNDVYPEPQQVDDSHFSDVQYVEEDYDLGSFHDNQRGSNLQRKGVIGSVAQQTTSNDQPYKRRRNDDFFLSFADSLINHGNLAGEHQN